MSYAVQSPQRPLPGAYVPTPVASRYQTGPPRPSLSRQVSNPSYQQSQNAGQSIQTSQQSQQQLGQVSTKPALEELTPIARGSKAIQETLNRERKFPELDTYVAGRESSEYDISTQTAWAPFQKVKMYPIPDKIFQQYNRAQVSTMMGLFADLHHAWITIDNACYLWDYTHPHPDLVGFEEQPNSITAVRLVVPRPGVFVPSITRLLVVATTVEIILVGVSIEKGPTGALSLSLYQTRMAVPVRGMDIDVIEGSTATGRIFFSGRSDNDVYELMYQQEEKWFQSRCTKLNHTSKGITTLTPAFLFSQKQQSEHIIQMSIDDSRKLLYTLSSTSTIRVFHLKSDAVLELMITKTLNETLSNMGHIMTSPSELVSGSMKLVSICPISALEASKMHVMVTTSTGCRVFMSATAAYGFIGGIISNPATAPTSMQVQHIKFPPSDSPRSAVAPQQTSAQLTNGANQGINNSSKALLNTRTAVRYPPGYFFCFVSRDPQAQTDLLFVAAPDTGRIARPQEPPGVPRFPELGLWLNLGSRAEDIGLASPSFSATFTPTGFGNELAVQYDLATAEIAILTNTGVHTLRRRRLVDMFAGVIQSGGGAEGLEVEVKKFIRLYGRSETAATALGVACGQGRDVTNESRVASIMDPDILARARTAFIDFGGKPHLNENSLLDQSLSIDMVSPSPRHDGLALYIARLVRSIWPVLVAKESVTPTGGLAVQPAVSLTKLREVQLDLTKLQEFLDANKTFIDGLAGPEALGRVTTKQEEIALQAEHRALHSLVVLISNVIEGLAFVLTLYEERVEEIVLKLANSTRKRLESLTYEGLFCTANGKELAKELVKAVVDRNIANGSNVDTVAEALRRRCGSFCSAEDVVIFKAQEQLRRAAEAGSGSELGRNLLNESLRLFKQVAGNLSMEQLQWAVGQYSSMEFYAGAIELALSVAQEYDRGNRALSWIQDGRPAQDDRVRVFENRKTCYNLVHGVIISLDSAAGKTQETINGQYAIAQRRRAEAYNVINTSEDEVFQTDLYDWYLGQGQADRLLEIQAPYVVTYLERRSSEDITHADLLWRYYCQWGRYHDAAGVQLMLAKSSFPLPLDRRIEYLSRAKANASITTIGVARLTRHALLREVSDLLDLANIQDDILQKIKGDSRIAADARGNVLSKLDSEVLGVTELYNQYAEPAGYFDICILIYQAADHRNPVDIRDTWRHLLESKHEETLERGTPLPYEAVADTIRTLGTRLMLSESTFPVADLVPIVERYAFEFQHDVGPDTWVVDTFLDLQVPCETLFGVLEGMLYNDEAPFHGANRRIIAGDMLYVAQRWYEQTSRNGRVLGGEANAAGVLAALGTLMGNGLNREQVERCRELRARIEVMSR